MAQATLSTNISAVRADNHTLPLVAVIEHYSRLDEGIAADLGPGGKRAAFSCGNQRKRIWRYSHQPCCSVSGVLRPVWPMPVGVEKYRYRTGRQFVLAQLFRPPELQVDRRFFDWQIKLSGIRH